MISCAIILAGGKGERLRPLTEDRPKAMVELLGKPLIDYQINWLSSYGINKITIACGWRHEVIRNYLGDGKKWNVAVNYVVEEQPLGRGGALKGALKILMPFNQPVFSVNGDIICNLNLHSMQEFHNQRGGIATLASVALKSPYGILDLKGDSSIAGFREKPELPYWINGGIYVLESSIIELLPDLGDHEETTFPALAAAGKLQAFKTDALWRSVDTVKDLTELTRELESRRGALHAPVDRSIPRPIASRSPNDSVSTAGKMPALPGAALLKAPPSSGAHNV